MVDRLNEAIGKATIWLILIVVVISAGNAVVRYAIDWSSNGLLEIQWYLFSAIFLLCAGYVLNKNEHIRIDVIAGRLSPRAQNWIDVFGIVVFLLPMVHHDDVPVLAGVHERVALAARHPPTRAG